MELIGLAESGLRDCLPHLDVGDAFTLLRTPALSSSGQDTPAPVDSDESAIAARQELVDVLSGHAMLMNGEGDDDQTQWAPWSLRYSGHQFGTFAGQLGDGRAISIRERFLKLLRAHTFTGHTRMHSEHAPPERPRDGVRTAAQGRRPHAVLTDGGRARSPPLVHPRIPLCRRCVSLALSTFAARSA